MKRRGVEHLHSCPRPSASRRHKSPQVPKDGGSDRDRAIAAIGPVSQTFRDLIVTFRFSPVFGVPEAKHPRPISQRTTNSHRHRQDE